jgi:Raf kinase inhibitor-like YbhB/YbcL family protein
MSGAWLQIPARTGWPRDPIDEEPVAGNASGMLLAHRLTAPVLVTLCLSAFAACGSDDKDSETPSTGTGGSTGGAKSTPTGGVAPTTGGAPSTGGNKATGGATGGSATGGAATGGAATGGTSGGAGGSGGTAGGAKAGGGSSGSPGGGGAGKSSGGGGGISGGAGAGGTAGSGGAAGGSGGAGSGTFTLKSPAFDHVDTCSKAMPKSCDVFPNENLSYMKSMNVSPELSWSGAPSGTQSYAIVLEDMTNGAAHWVIWNIPGSVTTVAANIPQDSAMPAMPAGSQQASATFAQGDGYFGPGSSCNVYQFRIFALGMATFSPTQATDAGQVRTQLEGLGAQLLGQAILRGRSNWMMMCTN